MATSVNKNTFLSTYRDDYLDSDGYYRILFNSGKKLQARELTQMQTILQKQIERMGNNLFKDGTPILFGGHSVDNRYQYIKLDDVFSSIPSDLNTLVGQVYTGSTSAVQFEILQVVAATDTDPTTLYVRYLSTKNSADAVAENSTTVVVSRGEVLASSGNPGLQVSSDTIFSGFGSRFVLGESIYYAKGFFIYVEGTSLLISKYTNQPTTTIVLKMNESVVYASDDDGLYDNQGSVPNVTAPGADRYRIKLTLAEKSDLASDENGFSICDIFNGVIVTKTLVTDSYKIPNDLINLRIHENSGDYVAKNFQVLWDDDSDNDYLRLIIQDGVAVVQGARVSVGTNTIKRVPKPTATLSETDELVPTRFGNYVTVADAEIKGMPNLSLFDSQTIMDTADFAGNAIGKCKVRYISQDGADWRYYLFDINMNAGKDFRDAKSIGTGSTSYFNPTLVGGKTERVAGSNMLLFPLPQSRPKSLSNADITVQRYFSRSGILNGSVQLTVSGNEAFLDKDEWLITDSTGTLSPSITLNGDNTQATISGLPAAGDQLTPMTFNFATYVRKPNVNKLTKTLTTRYIDGFVESNGQGVKFIDLHRADVQTLSNVYDATDSDQEFTSLFTLDGGQRDNYYAKGRAVLKSGISVPAAGEPGGNGLRVFYKYFAHSGAGSYFDVGSYSGIAYKDIPDYTTNTGIKINLRNFMDFRPVQDSDGEYDNTTTGAKVFELPSPFGVLDVDAEYYQRRADRLVAKPNGVLEYIPGSTGIAAAPPKTPDGSLSLFTFTLNANTFDRTDLTTSRQSNKRYTMKDIGLLDDRLDRLENVVSLTLLENHTKDFAIYDSALIDRTKAGFQVDNFATNYFKDNELSRSAIDYSAGKVYPQQIMREIKLYYDSDHTDNVNVIRKGDYVFPKYTEEEYIDQSRISKVFVLNEFNVQSYDGVVKLSPSSDTWFDVHKLPRNVTDLGSRINTDNVSWYNKHNWNWKGKSVESLQVGDQTSTNKTGNTNYWLTVANSSNKLQYTGVDTYKYSTMIETMRSNKVYFEATGLQPNARHFIFFGGINVSGYCSDSDFGWYAQWDSDYGDIYSRYESHPNGAADALETDEYGTLKGSFFIPNNESLSFACGSQNFEILNISAHNPDESFSYASHQYEATGTLRHVQPEYTTTRVLEIKGGTYTYVPPPSNNSGGGDNDNNTGGGTIISDDNKVGSGNTWSGNISEKSTQEDVDSRDNGTSSSNWSDIRLKENITVVGNILGINVYSFNYIWDKATQHVGVMAQEILNTSFDNAVTQEGGYYKVDYSKLPIGIQWS